MLAVMTKLSIPVDCHLAVVNFKTCNTETDIDRHNLYSFNHVFVLKYLSYICSDQNTFYM